jgi:hypothetical protein
MHKRMSAALAEMADAGNPIMAAYLAGLLDAGHFRVLSAFGHSDDGEPEPYSLVFQCDVRVDGEWRTLCAPRWNELGFDEDDVLAAVADALAHPVDPDD